LTEQYQYTTGFVNLRCLIKLLDNPAYVEEMKASVYARLDQYMGGRSSEVLLKKSLEEPGEYSIREGKCLIRCKPKKNDDYDRHFITLNCHDCEEHHKCNSSGVTWMPVTWDGFPGLSWRIS
jgi:hypothetical protein